MNAFKLTSLRVSQSYQFDDVAIVIARIFIAMTAGVSYPINFFPARLAVLDFIGHSNTNFYVLTLIWYLVTMGISMLVEDLGVVFSVIGATVGVVVMFVLPGLLVARSTVVGVETPLQRQLRMVECGVFLCLGFMIGVFGILFQFYKA